MVDTGCVDAINPLDCDASVGCGERERVFAVGAPWCVNGEDDLELCNRKLEIVGNGSKHNVHLEWSYLLLVQLPCTAC